MQVHSNTRPARTIDDLVASLTGHLEHMAWKKGRNQEEREDLVSVAWVAIMESVHSKGLLEKSNPDAFAMTIAEYAMMAEYNRGHGDILGRPFRKDMVVPVDRASVLSLDKPLSPDSNASLLDLISDSSSYSSSELSSSGLPKPVQRALNKAIGQLPERQRLAVCCRNGLPGYGAHSLEEVACLLKTVSKEAAHGHDYRGRKALQSNARLRKAVERQIKHKPGALARSRRLGRMLRQQQLARAEVQG